MKAFWKSRPVKTVGILAALLVLGMLIAAATGHGETAQSGVLGTVFAPAHWAAEKISDGLATLSGNAKGNTEYEKKIDELQRQLGEMQEQLADYKNIKSQNEEYREQRFSVCGCRCGRPGQRRSVSQLYHQQRRRQRS